MNVPAYSNELLSTLKSFIVQGAGACTKKIFTVVIYGFLKIAIVFVPGKPFQPSLMFAAKA
jgi:hypothetical protein